MSHPTGRRAWHSSTSLGAWPTSLRGLSMPATTSRLLIPTSLRPLPQPTTTPALLRPTYLTMPAYLTRSRGPTGSSSLRPSCLYLPSNPTTTLLLTTELTALRSAVRTRLLSYLPRITLRGLRGSCVVATWLRCTCPLLICLRGACLVPAWLLPARLLRGLLLGGLLRCCLPPHGLVVRLLWA